MIARDNVSIIRRILDNCEGVWDQIVVVDTGSVDGTRELLRQAYPQVQVFEFEWCFDFSKARNFALTNIETETWMWLDTDDTFEHATAMQWRQLALELAAKKEPGSHIVLPYYYKLDERGTPLVVQYRERIFYGTDWEWREPLHEVCCYAGEGPAEHVAHPYPVMHRPERNPDEAAERNWRIMYRQYASGDRTARTLYYLMRMANGNNQPELALTYAYPMVNEQPGGYYEYEGLVGIGTANVALFKRTQDKEYLHEAVRALKDAVRMEPVRNEARTMLIEAWIEAKEYAEAVTEAMSMSEQLPTIPATLDVTQYGTYKYAILAEIHFKYLNNPYDAFCFHLEAMQTGRPTALSFGMDTAIRRYLEDNDIGIIYADESLISRAIEVRKAILIEGVFHDVWIATAPTAVNYARQVYVHLTEHFDSLYQDDGDIRLRKFLLTNKNPKFKDVYGYEDVIRTWDQQTIKTLIASIKAEVSIVHVDRIENIVLAAKSCRVKRCAVILQDVHPDVAYLWEVTQLELPRGTIGLDIHLDGRLIGFHGWTDDLVQCYMQDGRLHVPDRITVQVPPETSPDFVKYSDEGKPTVVIVASGVEEWDGTTPARWGIGASESCAVYLAEEFVQKGYSVRVYCPVPSSRIVAGVKYVPLSLYAHERCDLLIASRCPQILRLRTAKTQVLWMHDVPASYKIEDGTVVDHYIALSDWQVSAALDVGLDPAKIVLIPNGVHPHQKAGAVQSERKEGRTIWLSQPERGIEAIYGFWRMAPYLFSDLWAVYGFANYIKYGWTLEAFQTVAYWKHTMRLMKMRIVGRIPKQHLQALTDTCAQWVYPSAFPETFCVSALEALQSGLDTYVCHNGATAETVEAANTPTFKVVYPESAFDFSNAETWVHDIASANNALAPTEPSRYPHLPERFHWSHVVEEWIQLCRK